MQICVIDGQGGGIGSLIIRKLRDTFDESIDITALGTNAIATAQMLKARANRGVSGENAIVRTVQGMDVVIGPMAIVLAHAMMGEVTPRVAEAVSASPAKKFLIPLSQEDVHIVGLPTTPLPPLIEMLTEEHLKPLIHGTG